MAIETYFLDDVEGNKHSYDMQDFSRYHDIVLGGNGFSNTDDTDNMKYELSNNMGGKVGSGYVVYKGYAMRLTEPEPLTHDIADPDHARIDIVVARFKFDPEEAKFTVNILKGSPGSSPKKPSLTQNSSTYEIAIAEVKVNADESSLKEDNVTDKREGNYLPIDNLQRGVVVDENGMVNMPNQSYVEMNDSKPSLKPEDIPPYAEWDYFIVDINPDIDGQNEIKNGIFYPKADGTFLFTVHARFEENIEDESKFESFLMINDKTEVRDRLYLTNTYGINRQFYGANIKYLKKTDKLQLVIGFLRAEEFEFDYLRLNIAKLN